MIKLNVAIVVTFEGVEKREQQIGGTMRGLLNDRLFSISSPEYQLGCFLFDKSTLLYMPLSFYFGMGVLFHNKKFTPKSQAYETEIQNSFFLHFDYRE